MIPLQWAVIGAMGASLVSGYGGYQYAANKYEAAMVKASNDALQAKIEADKKTTDAANTQAEYTRNLDAEHAKELEASNARRADLVRSYDNSLRAIENRLGRCQSTTEALGAIVAEDSSRSREDRLREEIGRDFREVGERANELAATVKLCVAWVNEVGR